jgi:hypothetical protein
MSFLQRREPLRPTVRGVVGSPGRSAVALIRKRPSAETSYFLPDVPQVPYLGAALMASLSSTGITTTAKGVPSSSLTTGSGPPNS